MSIGSEIKKARGVRTATEVADAIGVHKSYLCDIENERRIPPPHTITAIATALDVVPDRWLWLWMLEQMSIRDALKAASYGVEDHEDRKR